MKLAKGFILGAWLLVGINLLMALGAIGIFERMTPAIADILSNNERSLQACEEMLAALVFAHDSDKNREMSIMFSQALERAEKNITETAEPEMLKKIAAHFPLAFSGNGHAIEVTSESIRNLAEINRKAMDDADARARQLGKGGAWGIVFMAVCAFLAGIIFIRNLNRKLLEPLEEIKAVIIANLGGETRRRCSGADMPGDIRAIYGNLNSVLDRCMHDNFNK